MQGGLCVWTPNVCRADQSQRERERVKASGVGEKASVGECASLRGLHQCRALVQRASVSLPAQSDRRESRAGVGMSVHQGLATLTTAARMA